MITAADYVEWCDFAGLYLGNASHADRYQTYAPKISLAGLVTNIVYDFLQSTSGGLDLRAWRQYDVYEMGADAKWRIEQTAQALESVGATRAAEKVRTVKDESIGAKFMELADSPEGIREAMKLRETGARPR